MSNGTQKFFRCCPKTESNGADEVTQLVNVIVKEFLKPVTI